MLKKAILYILFFLLPIFTEAQSYQFYHLTNEDGLPTNNVSSIVQDSKSFIWIGTQDGLCRYDGFNTVVFRKKADNLNSLSSSDIRSLYFHAPNNKLYIGTAEGLTVYDPLFNSFERVSLAINKNSKSPEPKINCIADLDNGTILIGADNGTYYLDVATKESKPVRFPVAVIASAMHNFNGTMFIGTDGHGLWTLSPDRKVKKIDSEVEIEKTVEGEGAQNINSIGSDDKNLYIATNGGGLLKLSGTDQKLLSRFTFADEKLNTNFIKSVKVNGNSAYLGTRGGFIVLNLTSGDFQLYNKVENDKSSINDDKVNSIFLDSHENVWLGTFAGGVNYVTWQSKRFPALPRNIANQFQQTFSIHEDQAHHLWIGGEHSLKQFNRKTMSVADHSDIVGANYILSITSGKEGELWLGTWGVGLIKYNPASRKGEFFLNDSVGGTILDLYFDKKTNDLWVGTYGDGLFILNTVKNTLKRFTTRNGLSSNNITKIFRDRANDIWLATSGGGACLIRNGNISGGEIKVLRHDDKSNSISSNELYSVSEDKNGNIWIATNLGLNRYDPKTGSFTNYYEDHGLINEFLYCALEDNQGNIWVSTNTGLTKFDPDNSSGTGFVNYDKSDGLLVTEHSQGAYLKASFGELIFGGVLGIDIIDPEKVNSYSHPPPVFILNYKRNGKDVATDTAIAYKKFIQLNWRENYFQFELGALFQTPANDFRARTNNKFKYILEGYDKEWSEPSNIRFVSYTELPGGEYTFKVTAANNDGVYNSEPFFIHIKVIPPFWKTIWFYVLVSVFGLAAIILFTQYRTRAIKKENKILEQKVAERTKELAEKNRDITSSIQYAKRIQEAILPSRNYFHTAFPEAFILYKPKDIVSGDFYWFGIKNNHKIFAVVDCTGHGVPGAFMSMIGYNLLNQIILEKGMTEPSDILNALHKGVQDALKQGRNEVNTNDGMDVSVISVNELTGSLTWAGAFRPVVIIRADGSAEKVDGNKFPIGGSQLDVTRKFLSQVIKMEKNDALYMFSDGYADQFGGDKGKKFMVKRFNDLLITIHAKNLQDQQRELEMAFEQWRGNLEQVDDVLVAGIRF